MCALIRPTCKGYRQGATYGYGYGAGLRQWSHKVSEVTTGAHAQGSSVNTGPRLMDVNTAQPKESGLLGQTTWLAATRHSVTYVAAHGHIQGRRMYRTRRGWIETVQLVGLGLLIVIGTSPCVH